VTSYQALGGDHPDTLASLSDMAMQHEGRGKYDRALPLYEECLAKRKRVLGDEHPDTLASLSDIAGLFQSKGEYDRALPLYEECLAKRKRVLGDEHPDTLASLMNLANLFASKGEYDRALPLNEECLTKHSRIFGDDHPYTLTALNNLAFLLYKRREYDRALPLYEQCLAKFKRVLGINHPDTCAVSKNYEAVKAAAETKAAAEAPSYGSIRRSEVAFIPHTGQNRGAMGIVRQVMYNGRRFAAKEPIASSSIGARDRHKFMKELEIHYRLHHPSCVSIYGACIDQEGIMLLMEWMDGGSLYLALSNHCEEPVLPRLRLSMARDIADGLLYLHTHRIIHRDIKSSNVLLTSDGRAKLCDFGLAKMVSASCASSSSGLALGTLAWAAPEVLLDGAEHSPASDVYSLGIVMWELMTCEVPFEGLDHSQMIARLRNHQRPPVPDPLPSGFSPEYVALMMLCWHQVRLSVNAHIFSFR
jgi:tetratricopeptide (TPR) repeat protein